MHLTRAALILVLVTAPAAWSSAKRPPVADSSPPSFRYYPSSTPLERIPLYTLDSSEPEALSALEKEVERLATHAKTLESGPERRAFQTRIHLLEKRAYALLQAFDAAAWESLRSDVRSEWEAVLKSLPSATPSTVLVTGPSS